MPLAYCAVQKGTYSAEEKVIQLQSELVGNASKVFKLVFPNATIRLMCHAYKCIVHIHYILVVIWLHFKNVEINHLSKMTSDIMNMCHSLSSIMDDFPEFF